MLEYLQLFADLWSVWILSAGGALFVRCVCEEKVELLKSLGQTPSLRLKVVERFFHTLTYFYMILFIVSLGAIFLLKALSYFYST